MMFEMVQHTFDYVSHLPSLYIISSYGLSFEMQIPATDNVTISTDERQLIGKHKIPRTFENFLACHLNQKLLVFQRTGVMCGN